jgi:hypothetical protein
MFEEAPVLWRVVRPVFSVTFAFATPVLKSGVMSFVLCAGLRADS